MSGDGSVDLGPLTDGSANNGFTNFLSKANTEATNFGRNVSNGNYNNDITKVGKGVTDFLNSAWKYISGQSYEEKQDNEQKALHKASVDRSNALQAEQNRAAGLDRNSSITAQATRDSGQAIATGNGAVLPGGGTAPASAGGLGSSGPSVNEQDFLGV